MGQFKRTYFLVQYELISPKKIIDFKLLNRIVDLSDSELLLRYIVAVDGKFILGGGHNVELETKSMTKTTRKRAFIA